MTSPLPTKRHARRIFDAALKAADPKAAVLRHVRLENNVLCAGRQRYDLDRIRAIFVVGAGKATAPMVQAIEKLLGKRIRDGCIVVKDGHRAPCRIVSILEASHPVPDERGVKAATRIAEIARTCSKDDLLVCCFSGGASALLPLPAEGITLAQKQSLTRQLLEGGATIQQMNAVRKHLSAIKGGQLAQMAAPARVLSLLLSDVVGDDLSVIGSGPTAPDPSTRDEVSSLFRRFGIANPPDLHHETPKPDDPIFANVQNLIVGSNRQSIDAAASEAKALGYRPMVLSTSIEGETREIARMHMAIVRECLDSGRPMRRPLCLLSGGETTVTLRGKGKGGRNQEFALAAALEMRQEDPTVLLSAGTDGTDGPTDAAGAFAGSWTTADREAALRALDDNDAYHFLDQTGDLLRTGPTRTNVMDIRVILVP